MVRSSQRRDFILGLRNCFRLFHMFRTLQYSSSESSSDEEGYLSDLQSSDGYTSGLDTDSSMEEIEDAMSISSDFESEGEAVYELLVCLDNAVGNCRYVVERVNIARSQEYKFTYFLDQTEDDFRIMTCMSKESFRFVVNTIKDDPIFQNNSDHQQAPVHWQLACALDRLGNDGQGVSAGRSKVIFGLGKGTVFAYYNRVLEALVNVRGLFIVWPDRTEREQISRRNESLGFKGAVGYVDGTTFPLHQKPSYHGADYMDRKKRYSINAQIVCDDHHRITHMLTGMTGSTHDSRMFSQSGLVHSPADYFCDGQYLISDSAYAASSHLVPAYKSIMHDTNDPEEGRLIEVFNTHLAKARVVNKHTIGILKSRWTSLCELRICLRDQTDVYRVMKHTLACAILHNIVLYRDPWEDAYVEGDEPARDDPVQAGPGYGRRTPGQQKCYEVRMACLLYHESHQSAAKELQREMTGQDEVTKNKEYELTDARLQIAELQRKTTTKELTVKLTMRARDRDFQRLQKKVQDLEKARDVIAKKGLEWKASLERQAADFCEQQKCISSLDLKAACSTHKVYHLKSVIEEERKKYANLLRSHEDLQQQYKLLENSVSAGALESQAEVQLTGFSHRFLPTNFDCVKKSG